MANIAIFEPNKSAQYLTSVNTPEYEGNPDVIINPDISTVQNVQIKYWKRVGNTIVEMSAAEKQVITDAELQQRKSLADTFSANPIEIFTALIKVLNTKLPANKQITKQEMINAIKAEIL